MYRAGVEDLRKLMVDLLEVPKRSSVHRKLYYFNGDVFIYIHMHRPLQRAKRSKRRTPGKRKRTPAQIKKDAQKESNKKKTRWNRTHKKQLHKLVRYKKMTYRPLTRSVRERKYLFLKTLCLL